MPNSSGPSDRLTQGLSMPMHLIGFGAFTSGSSLLDGSESDGTSILTGGSAMTSGWSDLGGYSTTNNGTAPDGTTTALLFTENGFDERHGVFQQPTITATNTHTFSIYAKQIARRYIQVYIATSGGTSAVHSVYFDLQGGSVTDSDVVATGGGVASIGTPTIQAAVNGFYKCTIPNIVLNNTNTTPYFQIMGSNVATYGAPLDLNNPQYTGADASALYFWRPKLVVV